MPFIVEFSAIIAALLWSASSFVFTNATERIGAVNLNISRMTVATILLLLTMWIFGISFRLSWEQIGLLSFSAVLGLVIGDTFLFKSFQYVGPRVSMLIMSLNPGLSAILAFLVLGEELSLMAIFGIAITLTGISIVILEKPKQPVNRFKISTKGVIFAIIGATGQGSQLIVAKQAYLLGEIHSLSATFYRILAAVIIMVPMAVAAGRLKTPIKTFVSDKTTLGLVVLGAIIGPFLGITFSFIAITEAKIGIASTLMATMPIMMLPLSKIIYKEKLTPKAIIGAFIAVAGVSLLFLLA